MKYIPAIGLALASIVGATAFADIDASKLPPAATKKGVTYVTDIKPILQASCFRCHGAERPKAGLRLDTLEDLLKGSKEGPVVVVGDSAKSRLVVAVSQLDSKLSMPPKPRGGPGGPGAQPGGTNAPFSNRMVPLQRDGTNFTAAPHGTNVQTRDRLASVIQRGTNAPGGGSGPRAGSPGGNFAPIKPLTPEQVGLVRAWIDQGAK